MIGIVKTEATSFARRTVKFNLKNPKDVDHKTLIDFYWHQDAYPMNFTNFAATKQPNRKFENGFCVYLEFTGEELVMGMEKCDKKIAYVCELN